MSKLSRSQMALNIEGLKRSMDDLHGTLKTFKTDHDGMSHAIGSMAQTVEGMRQHMNKLTAGAATHKVIDASTPNTAPEQVEPIEGTAHGSADPIEHLNQAQAKSAAPASAAPPAKDKTAKP